MRARVINGCLLLFLCAGLVVDAGVPHSSAHPWLFGPKDKTPAAPKKDKKQQKKDREAAKRFAKRAEALLAQPPVSKGDWGVLITDAQSGEPLYERDADKYFVPASNMKLFTTALALAKLGPDYRFRTTLETHGGLGSDGVLSGDLFLVGRGDPNLSNRKFPYDLK